MKRIIVVLLAAILAFSLCACGLTDLVGGLTGGLTVETSEEAAPQQTEEAPAVTESQARQFSGELPPVLPLEETLKVEDASDAPTEVTEFTDVAEDSWYYDAVQWAAAAGIVAGGTFSPNDPCTRAQALTFLWRVKGQPSPASAQNPFTDVAESDFFFQPVLWALENGLISAGDGQFHPNDPVTRAMTVTFLYRAEGSAESGAASPFVDVTADDWFGPAAIWTWWEGIVTLNAERTFHPGDACARAHYINFLYRCYGAE